MSNDTIRINGITYPFVDWDITQYGRDLEVTFGKGQDVDWTAGLGHGYIYSDGFDATLPELRLAPHRLHEEVVEATEKHGAFWETAKPYDSTVVGFQDSGVSKGNTANVTVAITPGTNADRLVICFVSTDIQAATDYDSLSAEFPTCDGTKMSIRPEVSSDTTPGIQVYYITNPTSSAGDVNVIFPNAALKDVVVTCVSLYNVLQVDPFGIFGESSGSSTTPSATANPDYSLVVSGVSWVSASASTPTITATAPATLRVSDVQQAVGAGVGGCLATSPSVSGASVAVAYTLSLSAVWRAWSVGILPALNATFVYFAEDRYIHKYTCTSTSTVEGDITRVTPAIEVVNAEFGGRPEYWSDHWYLGAGPSAFVQFLTSIGATTDTWSDTDWIAGELCAFQDGATPELAAAIYDDATIAQDTRRLATASTTPTSPTELIASNFTVFGLVGNTFMTAIQEIGGFLIIGNYQGLYEIDRGQVARPVVPLLPLGNLDPENGGHLAVWGDIIVYPRSDALWGYLVGRESFKMGVESLVEAGLLPRLANSGISTILDRRGFSPVLAGAGFYYCQATSTTTGATIYIRKRREMDSPGGDFLTHMLWDGDRWKGGKWDSQARLWMKDATNLSVNRGLTLFHTGSDGSPNTATRRGDVSTAHKIIFPPITPTPFRTTQLRAIEVETSHTWDATTSLQLGVYLDETDAVSAWSTAITSAGIHVKNPTTFGTADQAQRYVLQMILTTNGSYTPLLTDAHIRKIKMVFRTPQITRYTIPADNKILAETDPRLNGRVVRKALQGLLNQGPVTVSPPDPYATGMVYDTNYSGEVVRCDERVVRAQRVIDVYLQKFVQD